MRHNIRVIKDNQPSNEEVNNLLNLIHKYKDEINNCEIEKNKNLIESENKFNNNMEQEKNEYKKLIIDTKLKLQKELTKCENDYNNQIAEIKKKCYWPMIKNQLMKNMKK